MTPGGGGWLGKGGVAVVQCIALLGQQQALSTGSVCVERCGLAAPFSARRRDIDGVRHCLAPERGVAVVEHEAEQSALDHQTHCQRTL